MIILSSCAKRRDAIPLTVAQAHIARRKPGCTLRTPHITVGVKCVGVVASAADSIRLVVIPQ